MNHTLESKLKEYAKFKTEKDISRFESLIETLSKSNDSKNILIFLNCFDDNTQFEEVMFTLIHAIERYPKEIYIPILVSNIPYALKYYPYWLERLINRIFNDKLYLLCFKSYMNLIPKEDMAQLLDLVAQESEHHRELCAELKKELYKKS